MNIRIEIGDEIIFNDTPYTITDIDGEEFAMLDPLRDDSSGRILVPIKEIEEQVSRTISSEISLNLGDDDILVRGNLDYMLTLCEHGCKVVVENEIELKEYILALLVVMHLTVHMENHELEVTKGSIFKMFKTTLSALLETASHKLAKKHK